MERYDVVIVGAGPAGIFAALELLALGSARVAVVEQGADLPDRIGAVAAGARDRPGPDHWLEGFGGAGAFCDGKLTLTTQVGGYLAEIVGFHRAEALLREADARWLEHGAPTQLYGTDEGAFAELSRRATLCALKLVSVPLRHMGTDGSTTVLGSMRAALQPRVELLFGSPAAAINVENGHVCGVDLADGTRLACRAAILAPGRSGSAWLRAEASRLDLAVEPGPVDLGVRVEVPAAVVQELTDALYEFKLLYWARNLDNLVRTFCVCPRGEVVTTRQGDVLTVNGHSYAEPVSENTNFAVLVSSRFTEPFDDPIGYGQYIAGLANLLGDGVLVQRLGDLRNGRRSTPRRLRHSIMRPTLESATPGDLSYVLPYRHLAALLEMMEAIDRFATGVGANHTLLYGVEVKLYSSRIRVTESLETQVEGLFVCGDGAGLTRGLMQASASGILAARGTAAYLAQQ